MSARNRLARLQVGLGLPDVRALAILSNSETEARDLTAGFGPKSRTARDQARTLVDEWIAGRNPASAFEKRSPEPDPRSPNS